MNINVYTIINNPLPELYSIKNFDVNLNEFNYDEDIVKMLNKNLKMDKLSSEHIYALGLNYNMIPKGIIQVSIGNNYESNVDIRDLATGLLLIGAEQFMMFHNHPSGNKEVSIHDKILTSKYIEVGDLIGISFIRHLMITENYYCKCEEV